MSLGRQEEYCDVMRKAPKILLRLYCVAGSTNKAHSEPVLPVAQLL